MFIDVNHCDWCEKELSDYYLIGHTVKDNKKLKFCNFVCAKHYNDILEKINVNFNKYAELFTSKKLDKQSAKIFNHVSKLGFEFMPTIYGIKYDKNKKVRQEQVRKYINKIYDRN